MRSRLFNFLSCLLLTSCAVQAAQAADLTQQRQLYDEAKRALAKGDSGPYFQNAEPCAAIRSRRIWPMTS
jgi:soluble lytic murein transglycosylase